MNNPIAYVRELARRHHVESRVLVAFLAVAAIAVSFFKLASEVMEGDTLAFDQMILRGLRSAENPAIPNFPSWMTTVMKDVTALGSLTVLTIFTMLAVGYLLAIRKRGAALYVGASVATGGLLISLLKSVFERHRPDVVPHLISVSSMSFPSGHATSSALVYLTLAALVARTEESSWIRIYLIGAALVLTFVVGFSRVYLGVHYPSDVVAGWTLGAMWAVAASLLARTLQRKDKIEQPGPEPGAN